MKNFAIRASFNPQSDTVRCTIPAVHYETWLQGEGKLFATLCEEVVHGDNITTMILSASWFDVCKRYCRNLLTDIQKHDSPDMVLSGGL